MRHLHGRRARGRHQRRVRLPRARGLAAFAAVLGPGLLAGLSDEDPAEITTYSILGADHGYQLLWVLAVATVMLVLFHDLGSRLGVVTGRGPMALLRERHGARWAHAALVPLVVRQPGDRMRRVRGRRGGDRAGRHQPLSQRPHRRIRGRGAGPAIELPPRRAHTLVLSAVFVAYVIAGLLAHPDWSAAVRALVVPSMPLDRDGLLAVTAMVGTGVAPWGLAFIGSYAAHKRLGVSELRYERIDVVTGAIMTGVIGAFVVIACAATVHAGGRSVDHARDAATALEPLAGSLAAPLSGVGLLGAALLAASVVPRAAAYSVSEAAGPPGRLDDPCRRRRCSMAPTSPSRASQPASFLIPGTPLIRHPLPAPGAQRHRPRAAAVGDSYAGARPAADGRACAKTNGGTSTPSSPSRALMVCVTALGWLTLS